jgi:glucose-6-phosphate 1-dehydrogenase
VRRDEVEAQWAWVDRIRAQWQAEGLTPKTYTAGTWGRARRSRWPSATG